MAGSASRGQVTLSTAHSLLNCLLLVSGMFERRGLIDILIILRSDSFAAS